MTKTSAKSSSKRKILSPKTYTIFTSTGKINYVKLLIYVVILALVAVSTWGIYYLVQNSKHHYKNSIHPHPSHPNNNPNGSFFNSTMLYGTLGGSTPSIKGYYIMQWKANSAPDGDWDFGVWFSGRTAVESINQEIGNASKLTKGDKYLSLGGGNNTGTWSGASDFDYIVKNLGNIKQHGWDGLCFDVEMCAANVNFVPLFTDCFAKCKAAGLKVLVTTSHSLPYACQTGAGQGSDLVNAWINDVNIDYISPQLYSQGTVLEPSDLSIFEPVANKLIPSIPYSSDWDKLDTSSIGITPAGYILWNSAPPTPPGPTYNYCGTTWAGASGSCTNACPTGQDNECPAGQKCFGQLTKCPPNGGQPGPTPSTTHNYCGTGWANANSECKVACPDGTDTECPSGQHCYADLTGCPAN
jgi:hypothetical protein